MGAARGFTLIELMMVVVLLGITATFVVVGAGRMAPRLATGSEAARVAAAAAEARALAMAGQRDVRLEIIGGRHLRTSVREGGGWMQRGRPTTLRRYVSARIDGAASGHVHFLPEGRVAAPAIIEVLGAHRREVLSILASGMAKRAVR